MVPDKFSIKAAPEGDFTTLVISKCSHGVYLDEFRPRLIVPSPPDEVAEAICFDYKKGCLEVELGVAEPGLFWIDGAYDVEDEKQKMVVRAEANALFLEAHKLQMEWFHRLVAKADDLWGVFKRRNAISQVQKIACSRLKLQREWMLEDEVKAALSECPMCFDKVNPRAIVCRGCNYILKPEEHAQLLKSGRIAATAGAATK